MVIHTLFLGDKLGVTLSIFHVQNDFSNLYVKKNKKKQRDLTNVVLKSSFYCKKCTYYFRVSPV